MKKNNSKH